MAAGRPKLKTHQRFFRRCKKSYSSLIVISLLLMSAIMSGIFVGVHLVSVDAAKSIKKHKTIPLATNQSARILSGFMEQTIGACYYDTYEQNDTLPNSAQICDSAMLSYQQLCRTNHLDACDNDYLTKYLKGMGD